MKCRCISLEIKKISHPYNPSDIYKNGVVLILGFFDGVHRGHQEVIKEGVKIAKQRGLKSAVMTFNRHPGIVYRSFDPKEHAYLTPIKRKESLIEALEVDILYEVDFTSKLGSLTPQEFVDQYVAGWNAEVVVAGFDYTYGKADIANMEKLKEYAKNRFEVITIDKHTDQDKKISSTRIRQAIAEGKMTTANELLGYIYETSGFVIHGDARGRTLGYPTANIFPHPYVYIPKRGVYAVRMNVHDRWYDGMASIGYNVTFESRRNYSVEVHLFDFNEEIYGEDVRVQWVKYLREEIKFDSKESLIEQLDQDEIDSKETLAILKD